VGDILQKFPRFNR